MKHRIITTLDTNDTQTAFDRLYRLIAQWPEATVEIATDVYSVELEEWTPGATLRDVIDTLDREGFLA